MAAERTEAGREKLRIFPQRQTVIDHYPIHEGEVVVRWWSDPDPDACGYIVEANVGGVIVQGAGHYGESLYAATEAGENIAAALRAQEPTP